MKLTTQYYECGQLMADPLSDPLCQMLLAEGEEDEIDVLLSWQLAAQQVKPTTEMEH